MKNHVVQSTLSTFSIRESYRACQVTRGDYLYFLSPKRNFSYQTGEWTRRIRTRIVIPNGRARRVREGPYDALARAAPWTGLARGREVRLVLVTHRRRNPA